MNKILLAAALKLLELWIGGDIFERIIALVDYMAKSDKTGSEKLDFVVSTVKGEYGAWSASNVTPVIGGAIRAIVEVYLLKLKAYADKKGQKPLDKAAVV